MKQCLECKYLYLCQNNDEVKALCLANMEVITMIEKKRNCVYYEDVEKFH